MSKIHFPTLFVAGLLLASAAAAAHDERAIQYQSSFYDYADRGAYRDARSRHGYRDKGKRGHHELRHKRAGRMPRWLEQKDAFRHWFGHSRLRKNYQLSWNQLFDIYRWERAHFRYRRY
jgi:hypothetical protein